MRTAAVSQPTNPKHDIGVCELYAIDHWVRVQLNLVLNLDEGGRGNGACARESNVGTSASLPSHEYMQRVPSYNYPSRVWG
jgi:hypothetical protein